MIDPIGSSRRRDVPVAYQLILGVRLRQTGQLIQCKKDAADKVQALAVLKLLGTVSDRGEVVPDPQKLEAAPRRTVTAAPACPSRDTPTYLQRYEADCEVAKVLKDAKGWRKGRR